MRNHTGEISPQRTARIAGALYLSLLPLGIFGLMVGSSTLVIPGDAAATASNILASETLFRLVIVSALLIQVINTLVAVALYRLLRPVNQLMASLMVIFILLGAPIAMLSELNRIAVLVVLHSSELTVMFPADQLHALVPFFLDLHEQGINIASIFWGLWLFPMGYLVFKSGFLPRWIGVLLIIGCFGYLVDFTLVALFPTVDVTVAQFTFIGELVLPLWLLIKGVNVEWWEQRALAAA